MTERQHDDDLGQRVRQASGGEPEAGIRAEEQESAAAGRGERAEKEPGAAGRGDAPEEVREEDSRATTERIERMQREGKGMGGTSTQGRTDVVDEEAIERARRGEESEA